ncbi:MAG: type IV toxin-antitoxin system AbiEi family antitoxin domain-containing protein [Acidimicrobiales bacterium]
MSHPCASLEAMHQFDEVAAAQHNLLTYAQLREQLSRDQIHYWVASGRIDRLYRGVYRVMGAATSWEQSLHAVVLATGAVASHRSAGRLWELPVPRERLEVLVAAHCRVRLPGVTCHRSNLLLADFVTIRNGIPVTTAARTVADLTAVLGEPTCARAIDAADRHGVASYLDVDGCYRRMRRRGRRRMTVLERLLTSRLDGDVESGDSDWEMRLAQWLVDGGLGRPVLQHWVAVAGDERFCLDLAYPDQRLAVEFDGWSTHRQRGRYDSDRRRWRLLTLAGWTVLAYTSCCRRDEVVTEVAAALGQGAMAVPTRMFQVSRPSRSDEPAATATKARPRIRQAAAIRRGNAVRT